MDRCATVGKHVFIWFEWKRSSLPTRPVKSKKLDKADRLVNLLHKQFPLKAGLSAYVHKQQIDQCPLHCNPVSRHRLQDAGCRNLWEGCSMEFLQVNRKHTQQITHVIHRTNVKAVQLASFLISCRVLSYLLILIIDTSGIRFNVVANNNILTFIQNPSWWQSEHFFSVLKTLWRTLSRYKVRLTQLWWICPSVEVLGSNWKTNKQELIKGRRR